MCALDAIASLSLRACLLSGCSQFAIACQMMLVIVRLCACVRVRGLLILSRCHINLDVY